MLIRSHRIRNVLTTLTYPDSVPATAYTSNTSPPHLHTPSTQGWFRSRLITEGDAYGPTHRRLLEEKEVEFNDWTSRNGSPFAISSADVVRFVVYLSNDQLQSSVTSTKR